MKHVFLVDDSATMLMSLKGTLEMSGFKVDTAGDGQAALDRLKTGLKPDLIITDINMPRMDGIQLIREARKLLRFTPILALTTESGAPLLHKRVDAVLTVPETEAMLLPQLGVIPLQLLSYYTALERGCDIDKPRNLAKSVTVE